MPRVMRGSSLSVALITILTGLTRATVRIGLPSRHVARIVVAFGHHSGYGRGEHGVLAGVAEGTLGRGKCVSGVDELDLHLVHLLLGAASSSCRV